MIDFEDLEKKKIEIDILVNILVEIEVRNEETDISFDAISWAESLKINDRFAYNILKEMDERNIFDFIIFEDDHGRPIFIISSIKKNLINENIKTNLDYIFDSLKKLKLNHEDLLKYSPFEISKNIDVAKEGILNLKKITKSNNLLRPLNSTINDLEKNIEGINNLNENYLDYYKNIIKPIEMASKNSEDLTVKWGIIGIVITTVYGKIKLHNSAV